MKTRGFIVTMFALAVSFAPQFVNTSSAGDKYSAQLISPRPGQVVHPGQIVMIQWNDTLPNIILAGCEMEIWLSLDGGKTFPTYIVPFMDPRSKYFYWTVPNTPTNAAVLDIRFGCDLHYPESYSPQPASTFVIAQTAGQLY
jgi:hypothetical protein